MPTSGKNWPAEAGMAFDKASVRSFDENGFLHVAGSHITKATVNPYYGREIPGGVEHGYHPDSVYYGLRSPEALEASARTWAGLPVHALHHMDSADDPQRSTRVGSVGTEVVWNAPYLDAPITVWDRGAIDAIEDGSLRELSCAYRYDADFTAGQWEGMPYDFSMTNIRGNHVALVERGRAGRDVLVADRAIATDNTGEDEMSIEPQTADQTAEAQQEATAPVQASDGPETEQKEVDLAQAIIDLHRIDPATGEVVDIAEDEGPALELRNALGEISGGVPPEKLARIMNALKGLSLIRPMPAVPDEAPKGCDAPEGEAKSEDPVAPQSAPAPAEEAVVEAVEENPVPDACPATGAQDADSIRAEAIRATKAHMKALFKAVTDVRPLSGNLDPLAFDSAEDVYAEALKARGYDPKAHPREAWRSMVDVVLRETGGAKPAPMAQDSAPKTDEHLEKAIKGLETIRIA